MTAIVEIMLERRSLGEAGSRLARWASTLGVACLGAAALGAWMWQAWRERFFPAYLTAFAWALSLTLGTLFFVVLQHLVRAGWSVVVRRLAEFFAAQAPLLAVLFVPILFGLHDLYHWTHAEAVAADPLLLGKKPYLNLPFFLIRLIVYFVFWIWTGNFFLKQSVAQDESGDVAFTEKMQRMAPVAMLGFGLTTTFAAFDLLMSLDPHWYSTIFGVYFFSGSVLGAIALLVVTGVGLQRAGYLRRTITREHYHDLGKLLFAFVVFWAYIAYSQFMLIWYGNIPEETSWIMRRTAGGFGVIGLILLFGHFIVPFALLLPRSIKRSPGILFYPALWLLLVHYVDIYWLVMPEFGAATPGLVDVLVFLGVAALWFGGAARLAARHALTPQQDPRLDESLTFENA